MAPSKICCYIDERGTDFTIYNNLIMTIFHENDKNRIENFNSQCYRIREIILDNILYYVGNVVVNDNILGCFLSKQPECLIQIKPKCFDFIKPERKSILI